MTTLIPVAPPAALPLSLAELRAQCRLSDDDPSDEDAILMGAVNAAVEWIDGADGWLKRALITQTWDWSIDAWPGLYCGWPGPTRWGGRELALPLPPLQSIQSITYLDSGGNPQVLPPNSYRVLGAGGSMPARLVGHPDLMPAIDLMTGPEVITIRFVAGYGDDWNSVPHTIRQALMLLTAYWFNQREGALIDPVIVEVPFGVRALLANYRILHA